ncbi:hypothetical protein ABZT04_44850 [Streptomyces sp. NPDC005492]|uniref:hypothetical protein n=1 Tax=Streptomyces sp. NPDC005492 TaxID=3156883 RepID=UPI0033AB2D93
MVTVPEKDDARAGNEGGIDLAGLQHHLHHVRDRANDHRSITFPVEEGVETSRRL